MNTLDVDSVNIKFNLSTKPLWIIQQLIHSSAVISPHHSKVNVNNKTPPDDTLYVICFVLSEEDIKFITWFLSLFLPLSLRNKGMFINGEAIAIRCSFPAGNVASWKIQGRSFAIFFFIEIVNQEERKHLKIKWIYRAG